MASCSCPNTPANAHPICDSASGACGFACNTNFTRVSDTSCVGSTPDNCNGNSCPSVLHGFPLCTRSLKCASACNPGFKPVNSTFCVGATASNCNDISCPTVPNSQPVCRPNLSCGIQCNSGYMYMNGSCVGNTAANCNGIVCPSTQNGKPVCSHTLNCLIQCDSGYIPSLNQGNCTSLAGASQGLSKGATIAVALAPSVLLLLIIVTVSYIYVRRSQESDPADQLNRTRINGQGRKPQQWEDATATDLRVGE